MVARQTRCGMVIFMKFRRNIATIRTPAFKQGLERAQSLQNFALSASQITATGVVSGNVFGTAHIAVDMDWRLAERLRSKPLLMSGFADKLMRSQEILSHHVIQPTSTSQSDVSSAYQTLLQYIAAVQRREVTLEQTATSTLVRRRRAKSRKPKPGRR